MPADRGLPAEDDLRGECRADGVDQIAVGAYITDAAGRVLILRRARDEFKANLYDLPSGKVESGESLSDALRREVWEETGLRVGEIEEYVCAFDYPTAPGLRVRQLNFAAHVPDTSRVRLSAEHQDLLWVSPDDTEVLAALDPPMRRQLDVFFARRPR